MPLITRIIGNNPKGSELTYQEMDGNFIYLEGLGVSSSYFATTGSNRFSGNQVITGSLAQGNNVSASTFAHAEGFNTVAAFAYSHAEGISTLANNFNAHAEGQSTVASGLSSHAEGNQTQAIGIASHAEGLGTIASGSYSHAEGIYTVAQGLGQTVVGQYNILDNTSSLFVIGNGSVSNRRDLARFDSSSITFFYNSATNYAMSISGSQVIVMPQVSSSLNFANDAAAAAGGVPRGGLYRSGSFILIRLV
jgi:uncharacterized phage infection (PIP) family protein YhgE